MTDRAGAVVPGVSRGALIALGALGAGVALGALAGCAAAEPGTEPEPLPIACDGVTLGLEANTVLRPGVEMFPAYTLSGVWDDGDGVVAGITGVDEGDGGFGRVELRRGETVEDPVAGVFTLLDATPADGGEGSPAATLCLDPHPDFELADGF